MSIRIIGAGGGSTPETDPLSLHLDGVNWSALAPLHWDNETYELSVDLSAYLTSIAGQDLSTADNATSAFITAGDIPAIPSTTDDLTEGSTNLYNRVPTGGSAGQVLAKIDGADYNTEWVTDVLPAVPLSTNDNPIVNAWHIIKNATSAFYKIINGWVDRFIDETGVDTGACTNQHYDAGNFYEPTTSGGGGGGGGGGSYPSVPAVAHYKCNDTNGTTLVDSSGNSKTGAGTYTATDGKINGGILLNGSSDKLETSAIPSVGTSPVSVSAWFKTSASGYNTIVKWGSYVSPSYQNIMDVCLLNGNFGIEFANISPVWSSSTFNDGLWHHGVLTFDGTYINAWVDNTQVITNEGRTLNPASGGAVIGARYGDGFDDGHFNGSLDDIRIFPVVLTPSDISLLYNSGNGTESDSFIDLSDSLVAHYKMNDNRANTVVVDNIGANHGTAQQDTNVVTVAGKIDKALSFDGSSDYVSIGSSSGVNPDRSVDFSFSFWVYMNSYTAEASGFIVNTNSANYKFFGVVSTTIYMDYNGSSVSGSTVIPLGQWKYIVINHVANTDDYKWYVDGTYTETLTCTGSGVCPGNMNIGGGFSGGSYILDGLMDDVRIYNYTLQPADITLIYNFGNGTESDTFIDLSDSLVAHYKMNDNRANTVVVDNIGANHGTAQQDTNVVTVAGKIDKALSFNGTSDFVDLSTLLNGKFTTAISASAWVYADDLTGYRMIVENNGGSDASFFLGLSDGNVKWQLYDGSWHVATGITTLSTSQWYHITGTWDGIEMNIYVNGVSDATPLAFSGTLDAGGTSAIGRDDGGNPQAYWSGVIDDVRLYSKALSPAEIKTIYNATNGTEADEPNNLGDGLVAHYKLNDNAANTNVAENINGLTGTSLGGDTNTVHVTGVIDGAFHCTGFAGSANTGVQAVTTALPTNTDPFTMSAWAKWANTSSINSTVIALSPNGQIDSGGGWAALMIMNGNGQNNHWALWTMGGFWDTGVLAVADGLFHLATMTYDGAIAKFYYDGAFIASSSTMTIADNPQNLYVGVFPDGYGNCYNWDGDLDDARLYNRAITATEVAQIYGLGGGLLAHYKCNDVDGTTAVDNINAYNGTGTYTPVAGKIGGAIGMNGTTDYIVTGLTKDFGTADFTIAYWNYLSAGGPNAFQSDSGSIYSGIVIDQFGSCYISSSGSGWDISHVSLIPATSGAWYHTALTRVGTTLTWYVNGSVVATDTGFSGAIYYAGTPMVFGITQMTYPNGYGGNPAAMDDVRIYDRGLSQDEITELAAGTEVDNKGTEGDGIVGGGTPPTPPTIQDMTLISLAQTALATPTTGRLLMLEQDVDTVALNTDLVASISKDNGSTYEPVTLTHIGDLDSTKRILAGEASFASGSGTSVRWKVETHGKDLKVHGISEVYK